MDQKEVIDKARRDLEFVSGHVLGIMLFGSWAKGGEIEGSDVDICIVAPDAEDKIALWRGIISRLRDDRYDIRIFELMPMFLKAAVIEQGIVVSAGDVPELYEYFYPFRRIWGDQKHRQVMTRDEVLAMFQ